MKYICVFCGSRLGKLPAYKLLAEAMGKSIAMRGKGLIYGGGNIGLMRIVADAVLAGGGEVIGVLPEFMLNKEIPHPGLSQLYLVKSMHERKALMADLSDAFIAMPGGYGTVEEFCEVLTWAQLELHQKSLGLLNVEGFYDPLIDLFNKIAREEFATSKHRALVKEASEPELLLDLLGIVESKNELVSAGHSKIKYIKSTSELI